MHASKILSGIKSLILPKGQKVREVRGGLLKGLKISVDLQTESQMYFGTWEKENHDWFRKLTNGAHTFIDVGANNGFITLFALAKTDVKQILAFEPDTRFHSVFKQTLRENGFETDKRVQLYPYGAGAEINSTTRTLDTFAAHIEPPCFIKIDVDGPEADVLRGSEQLLNQHGDVRLVIETHSKALEDECISILNQWEYQTTIIDNAWWRIFLPEERPIEHNRWLAAYK